MAYAEGTHFVIQAKRLSNDEVVYVHYTDETSVRGGHSALKRLALQHSKYKSKSKYYDDFDDVDRDPAYHLQVSNEPFGSKIWSLTTPPNKITDQIRAIRYFAGKSDIDPNSIRLMQVTVSMSPALVAPESDLEKELRILALEKLTFEEKELLKVVHWDVFHKLGDRTGLDDDPDDIPF